MKSEVSANTFFHVLLPAAAPEKPRHLDIQLDIKLDVRSIIQPGCNV